MKELGKLGVLGGRAEGVGRVGIVTGGGGSRGVGGVVGVGGVRIPEKAR